MKRRAAWMTAVLAGSSVATAGLAQQPAEPAAPKPRLICKRTVETGSLVAKRRECRTKQEWDRMAEAARANAEYENQRNMAKPSGA